MHELSKYKIQDFRNEILKRNTLHKELFVKKIKEKYKDIILFTKEKNNYKPGYGVNRYKYDFVWLDGIYNNKNFRICFYTQDIDPSSYNIHIYHDVYTFQKNLLKNMNGPYSLFNINISCKDSFEQAINNMKLSSYGIDNFDLDNFLYEFLNFIEYMEV